MCSSQIKDGFVGRITGTMNRLAFPLMGFVWLSVMSISHQPEIRPPDINQKRMVRPGAGATM